MLPNAYAIEVVHALVAIVVVGLWANSWFDALRGRAWASADPVDAAALETALWKVRIYGWLVSVAAITTIGAVGAVFAAPPDEMGRFLDPEQLSPARMTLVAITVALGMACVSEHAQRRRLTMT